LPAKVEGAGRLYLWFPLRHSLNKAIHGLHKFNQDTQLLEDGQCLLITFNATEIQALVIALASLFTRQELKDIQALLMPNRAEPQLRDFHRVASLHQFITLSQSSWLLDMLCAERLTSHFQPIVHAADTSQVFAQEALMRGIDEDGQLVFPGRILDLARDADLLFQVDLAARRTAIREAIFHRIQTPIFINFTPTSIYDPAFCLRSTIRAIDEAGIPHEHIVFEVIESDRTQDIDDLKRILNFYRAANFRVALDDVGSGYSSLNLIHQLHPDFIKLDMELIRNVHQDPYKALVAQKLLEIAQQLNILAIAEGIESPEELRWASAHGASFVQGYLIAKPTSPPVVTPSQIAV
jgi:EAL domain-containing protein (putative c-di-GMP-specific phosphodiesterase class I)